MKTILLYFSLLISGLTLAQTGINYKALVKDGSGNVLSSQMIDVEFTVIKNIGAVEVYKELHEDVMTDANGILILTIGGGAPSIGNYALIDWGSDSYALKTQIDIGSGLVINTTELQEVPFAATAKNISDAPSRTLEVAGTGQQKIRINSENGNIPALELMRTGAGTDWKIQNSNQWLDLYTSDDDFANTDIKFSFDKDGMLGINNSSPDAALDVNGTIQSTDLAGTGNRSVSADANGNLVIDSTPTTHYYSINENHFSEYQGLFGNLFLHAPVNLPHNAIITNFKVYCYDKSNLSSLSIELYASAVNVTGSIAISSLSTTGISSEIMVIDSGLIYHLVQNQSTSYYLSLSPANSSVVYIKGVVITYIIP